MDRHRAVLQAGRAEEIIGTALGEMAARPAVLTECGDVRGPDDRAYDDHRPAVIRAEVRASLRRLRCPVIDVPQLHDPDPDVPIEEFWQVVYGLIDEGRSPLASGFLADGFDLAAVGTGDLRRRLRWADPAALDLAALRRDLSAVASGAGLSMSALAAGWALAQGAQPIIGARTPAEARQIAAVRPIPTGLAAAAQAAADAACTATR